MATLAEAIARQSASQGASPFDRALTRYQNNQGILARIGEAGGRTLGVLSYALAPLDYLGGIARSTLFSGANAILPSNKQIDINKDGTFYNDQDFFTNLRRAVLKNPFDPNQRIAGFADTPGLQFSENDSLLERMAKGTLAFAGDVATDPTTYLSLGIAPVAKRLATKGISAITSNAAAKILSREAAESVVDDAAEVAAAKLSAVAARNEIRNSAARKLASRNLDIVNAAEVAGKAVPDYIDELLATKPDDLFATVSQQIGDEATAVFRGGDRRALKNYFNDLADKTGIDDFRTLWQAQSDAVRGGFRITTPSGKTVVRLTEGGDSPVLGTLTSPLRALGAKPLGLALTSGADRELAKAAKVASRLVNAEQGAIPGITDIVERGGLARAAQTEKALRLQREAARKERELIRKLGPEAKTIIYAHNKVADTYDQQVDEAGEALGNKYRAAVNRFYNQFDEEGGSDLLLINPKDLDEVSAVITDPLERDAFYTARAMRDYLYEKHNYLTKELGDDFNPVGSVQGALRDVTPEARQLEQELFGTTAARGGGGVKARRAYGVYDESGELVRWRSLEESNQLKKDEWTTYLDEAVASGKYKADDPRIQKWRERIATTNLFETDLPTIFANRINRIEKQVHKAVAVNLFKRSGLLLETETERALRPKRIVEIAREDIKRLKENNVDLAKLVQQANRLRPGAPTGETFDLAAGAMIRAQDVGAPADLVRRIEETALSAAEGEATINRTLARSEEDLQVLRDQIATNLNDIKQLNDAIVVLGNMDADAQADGFAALLDTVLDLRKSQVDRMAAQAGNTEAVAELRKSTEALLKAKKQDATQVLSLVARAEPMQRLGTVRGKRNELLQVERQFENLWAPAQVAEALTRAYRLTNDQRTYVEDAFRATTGVWKQMATFGRGPSFVFRNIGGWWNAFLVGANGTDLTNGLRYAAAYESALQKFRKNVKNIKSKDITDAAKLLDASFRETMEKSGKFMGYDNMYQAHVAMENQGIFGGTITAAAIDVDPLTNVARTQTAGQIVERGYQPLVSGTNILPAEPVAGRLLSRDKASRISLSEAVQTVRKDRKPVQRAASVAVNNPFVYVMRAFSEDSERFLRASTFSAGVRRHGADATGEEIASLLTKAAQFDYSDLSPSEQRVMKLISPFFIWTKNNVPFQFRNLIANPGKVNAVLKLQQNVKAQFEDKDDDMSEYMPQWLREQLGFASSFGSGENQLALGLNLPLTDINRFFEVPVTAEGRLDLSGGMRVLPRLLSAAVGGVRDDALGSASPFIKAPIEAATGVNLFTGAKFQEQAAGPVYRAASIIPGLPDTYVDPETGEVRSSGFAINQFRNLLPQLGQIDRLLPFGQQGEQQARVKGNWISQAASFLPVTVSATLTESQYAGELRTRNITLENQIRQYERDNGIPEGSLREAYNKQQQMLSSKARIRALAAALGPG